MGVASLTMGYPTSCPGPWYVASPPRSTLKTGMSWGLKFSGVVFRPSVMTWSCSTRMSVSTSVSPSALFLTRSFCSSHVSW